MVTVGIQRDVDLYKRSAEEFDTSKFKGSSVFRLLSSIKAEYGRFINALETSIRYADFIERKVQSHTATRESVRKLEEYSADLALKLESIQSDNQRLSNEIENIRKKRESILTSKQKVRMKQEEKKEPLENDKDAFSWVYLFNNTKLKGDQLLSIEELQKEALRLNNEVFNVRNNTSQMFIQKSQMKELEKELQRQEKAKVIVADYQIALKQRMDKLKQTIGIANKLSRDPKKLWQSAVAKVAGSGDFLNTLLKALDEYGKGKTEDVFRPFFSESENHDFDDDEPSKKHAIDNLIEYVDIFEEFMERREYPVAAMFAANSPKGCLRQIDTLKQFKEASQLTSTASRRRNRSVRRITSRATTNRSYSSSDSERPSNAPLFLYCSALMETGSEFEPLSGAMSREVIDCAIKYADIRTVRYWMAKNCLRLTAPLGDTLFEACTCQRQCRCGFTAIALDVFSKLQIKQKVAVSLLKLNAVSTLMRHASNVNFEWKDYKEVFCHQPSYELYTAMLKNANIEPDGLMPISLPGAINVLLENGLYSDVIRLLDSMTNSSTDQQTSLLTGMLEEKASDGVPEGMWEELVDICNAASRPDLAEEVRACVATRQALDHASIQCIMRDYIS